MTRDTHPDWCARGHRCGLGEHRAHPITITVPGAGGATLTRVSTPDGRQHAEIRLSITLPASEAAARLRLAALLTHLHTLIGPHRSSTGRHAA
jgi:hypothetical protein